MEDLLEMRPGAVRKSLSRCCFGQRALFPVMSGKTKLKSQAFSCVLGWFPDGGARMGGRTGQQIVMLPCPSPGKMHPGDISQIQGTPDGGGRGIAGRVAVLYRMYCTSDVQKCSCCSLPTIDPLPPCILGSDKWLMLDSHILRYLLKPDTGCVLLSHSEFNSY